MSSSKKPGPKCLVTPKRVIQSGAGVVVLLGFFLVFSSALPAFAQAKSETAATKKGELTRAPRLRNFVEPTLPEGAVLTETVVVVLKLSISAEGTVSEAEVTESAHEQFNEPAREAALKLEFDPAEIDGVPAPVRISYRYEIKPPVPTEKSAETAIFAGIVRDQSSKMPLAGVRVELDSGEHALTGNDGRFSIEGVKPGTHGVTLAGPTFTPVGTEETLEAGKRYEASYDVEVAAVAVAPEDRADFEIVIVATKLGSKVTATEVVAEQATRVAGTGGDVVKVVENLPGVARSTVGSGQLVVWGASSQDTRVYIDGVHIPVLYHEGGYRSVVHSDLVRSVELQPGGYGASYGRGLGGLVTVGLRPLDEKGYHGSVQVDAIDAAASLRGSIDDKWKFAAAARRAHLRAVVDLVSAEEVGEFVPIPAYWDTQARIGYSPSEGVSFELGGLYSSDNIDKKLAAADPSQVKSETKDTRFGRVYFRYRREDGPAVTTVTPFYGRDYTRLVTKFGVVPAELSVDSNVFGLRMTHQTMAEPWLAVGVGLDAEFAVSEQYRGGSLTTPPREGDLRVFGQRPADQVNADTWSVTVGGLAPYVEADAAPWGDKFHIIPGLRVEPQLVRASRLTPPEADVPPIGTVRQDLAVEPRLALRWNATDRISAKAAFGIYHQPPLPDDLSAVFGNPTLGPANARHFLVGGAFRLSEPLTFELTSFYSNSSDLAVRSPLSTPVQSQALIQEGKGRAYGTQFLLRHNLVGRFFGWISLSMIRSERTDAHGVYRPFDFDQTFVLNTLGSFDLGKGFEIGGRFRYATGYPRTPVERATYDARADAFEPVFGVPNSIRIPAFYALDARFAKRFKFGADSELELYLDVQNVTYHENSEEIVYNFDYSKLSYITGIPILPNLGAKLSW